MCERRVTHSVQGLMCYGDRLRHPTKRDGTRIQYSVMESTLWHAKPPTVHLIFW